MRRLILAAFLALWSAPVLAQGEEIRGVIENQFEAFRADDVATAFGFASPAIQGIFGTPENFGAMVREGYPMVWRPEAVQFRELREIEGRLWQRVIVEDGAGRLHALDYQMMPGPEGWRINGVQLLRTPEIGA